MQRTAVWHQKGHRYNAKTLTLFTNRYTYGKPCPAYSLLNVTYLDGYWIHYFKCTINIVCAWQRK